MALPDTANFDRLFDPSAVALVGASPDQSRINGRPQYFLEKYDFQGEIYPVNPNHDEIRGRPCYDSVADVPGDVDVAMILVPAPHVPDVLEECGEKGVAFNIIVGSGFSELGEEGAEIQAQLQATAEEYGVRVIGPNTLGLVDLEHSTILSFSTAFDIFDDLETADGLSIVSQSGGYGGMIFMITQRMGLGTKYWVATGNETDVDAIEFMAYMVQDPDVEMVVGYIESFDDAERFKALGEAALEHETPLVVLKVGQSDRSQDAIASHTGKMAGEYDVYTSVFDEYGVVQLEGVTDMKDVVSTLSTLGNLPRGDGGCGLLSPSGGAGVLLADIVERYDMPTAEFSEDTVAALGEIIPPYGNVTNPVDTTANIVNDEGLYERAIETLLADDAVETLFLQFAGSGASMAATYEDMLTEKAADADETIVAIFTGGEPDDDVVEAYEDAGIATFEDPVRAVRTLKQLTTFTDAVAAYPEKFEADAAPEPDATVPESPTWDEMKAACDAYDVPFADGRIAETAAEAVDVARDLGYPVVMKAAAKGLEHKTEADAIALDLRTDADVRETFGTLQSNVRAYDSSLELTGVTVQELVDDGLELLVGITETAFGPVMVFGWGGVYVEALEDVEYRTLPITEAKAEELVASTTVGGLLEGYRGVDYDRQAVVDLLVGASQLYRDNGLRELEFNPVVVDADGAAVVDYIVH